MKDIIVYYSKNGSTKIISEYLKEKINADIYEIVDLTKRKGFFGFLRSGFQAKKKSIVRIEAIPEGLLDDIDVLYLAAPVWAGSINPVLNTFISMTDFKGKTVNLITIQADPEHKSSYKIAEDVKKLIESKGGIYKKHYALTGANPGKTSELNDLKKQIDELF